MDGEAAGLGSVSGCRLEALDGDPGWLGWASGEHGGMAESAGQCDPSHWNFSQKLAGVLRLACRSTPRSMKSVPFRRVSFSLSGTVHCPQTGPGVSRPRHDSREGRGRRATGEVDGSGHADGACFLPPSHVKMIAACSRARPSQPTPETSGLSETASSKVRSSSK